MLSTAKPILEQQVTKIVYDGLYAAIKATYMGQESSEDGEDMAKMFAKKGSQEMGKKLADAIDTYVRQIGIRIIPYTLIAPPSGPVTGMSDTETKQITVY